MNSNNIVISVSNLEHSYGSTKVLNGLNFTIEKGKNKPEPEKNAARRRVLAFSPAGWYDTGIPFERR